MIYRIVKYFSRDEKLWETREGTSSS